MRIVEGFSFESATGWKKVDIEVDEMDLRRVLYAAGWSGQRHHISSNLVYQILQAEAELLMYHCAVQYHGFDRAEGEQKMKEAKYRKESALKNIEAINVSTSSESDTLLLSKGDK